MSDAYVSDFKDGADEDGPAPGYEESTLSQIYQIMFCENCQTQDAVIEDGTIEGKPLCQRDKCLQKKDPSIIVAKIFKHNPPTWNGQPLLDEEDKCAACRLALEPSLCYEEVNLCEKDLGSFYSKTAAPPAVDEICYCLDMSE